MSGLAGELHVTLDPASLEAIAKRVAELMMAADTGTPDPGGYLNVQAAADYLGVTRKRVYDLMSARTLKPDGKDGRTPLFTRATLDAYVRP